MQRKINNKCNCIYCHIVSSADECRSDSSLCGYIVSKGPALKSFLCAMTYRAKMLLTLTETPVILTGVLFQLSILATLAGLTQLSVSVPFPQSLKHTSKQPCFSLSVVVECCYWFIERLIKDVSSYVSDALSLWRAVSSCVSFFYFWCICLTVVSYNTFPVYRLVYWSFIFFGSKII